jgi:hypothetical protein
MADLLKMRLSEIGEIALRTEKAVKINSPVRFLQNQKLFNDAAWDSAARFWPAFTKRSRPEVFIF